MFHVHALVFETTSNLTAKTLGNPEAKVRRVKDFSIESTTTTDQDVAHVFFWYHSTLRGVWFNQKRSGQKRGIHFFSKE